MNIFTWCSHGRGRVTSVSSAHVYMHTVEGQLKPMYCTLCAHLYSLTNPNLVLDSLQGIDMKLSRACKLSISGP